MTANPPPVGPNLKNWAQATRDYLQRWLPRLQWKTADSNPSENGIILWDENEGRAVVSFGNKFKPLAYEDDMGDFDAFGRLRISQGHTLFDSKQINSNLPLYFDDQEVSGSGTTSTYSSATASSTLGVAAATAGNRVRQTFQRFNYQPGKSQLIMCTGVIDKSGGGTGITRRIGYFDDNNGVFWGDDEGTPSFTVRSSTTGSPVDNTVSQSSWNGDKLDGTGASGITLDPSMAQIFWCDIEWLGVGTVRCGFVVNGTFITCHSFHHANALASVYMSTPNLPIRYEIDNDGTGAASTMQHLCSTVISEGGVQPNGQLHYASTGGTHIDMNAADTVYAAIGIRLQSSKIGTHVDLAHTSILAETGDDFEWQILFNPTVAGTFTYSDVSNSSVQSAIGVTANTVTGGYIMDGGFASSTGGGGGGGSISSSLRNALRLGATIDGTPTEIVLCVRPLTANADIQASLSWMEM